MTGSLAGRVALVTGASSGIGEATALALAAAGASVAITARRAERLDALVQKIEAEGGKGLALAADVSDEQAALAVVARTIEHFGRIDILVNAAGVIQAGGIETGCLDEYRQVFDLNLMGTVYTCKAAVPQMKAQGSGDIINISSLAATKAAPAFNAYGASKHAVNAATDSLRQEVGAHGIRVGIVMPGATQTEMSDNINNLVVREAIKNHTTSDSAMAPGDVAAAIMLMVSLPRRTNLSVVAIRPTSDISA